MPVNIGRPAKIPTQPWPDDRKVVDLGTLTIEKSVVDSAEAERSLLFLPGRLTDGIEPSDDPLIDVRDPSRIVLKTQSLTRLRLRPTRRVVVWGGDRAHQAFG
jgi:hypothetical protein